MKHETKCLIKLTAKSAKLKCGELSTYRNREIKMRRKISVLQYHLLQKEYKERNINAYRLRSSAGSTTT